MKAILEFNLPEDNQEFDYAKNGVLYAIVLEDLDNWLRNKYKHEDQETISIEEVRNTLHLLKQERNLE